MFDRIVKIYCGAVIHVLLQFGDILMYKSLLFYVIYFTKCESYLQNI